ncbi:hypothetical protein LX36DRAFT_484872 [Colletotrichum falcatum]|nr:hypothetical protein LX36DRAFT_484872 [Colletotrichum falcatum]
MLFYLHYRCSCDGRGFHENVPLKNHGRDRGRNRGWGGERGHRRGHSKMRCRRVSATPQQRILQKQQHRRDWIDNKIAFGDMTPLPCFFSYLFDDHITTTHIPTTHRQLSFSFIILIFFLDILFYPSSSLPRNEPRLALLFVSGPFGPMSRFISCLGRASVIHTVGVGGRLWSDSSDEKNDKKHKAETSSQDVIFRPASHSPLGSIDVI